ncbi:MAG: hypothetical protein NTX15_10950 [Candidatus Kapabacteria bacterium]|nr:hypothetical protein [Candidatus Kapabacteria bacterium]
MVVITDQRVIIISERSWKFPFWVITYSQLLITETIAVADITSLSANGLNAATLDEVKVYIRG